MYSEECEWGGEAAGLAIQFGKACCDVGTCFPARRKRGSTSSPHNTTYAPHYEVFCFEKSMRTKAYIMEKDDEAEKRPSPFRGLPASMSMYLENAKMFCSTFN